ncbi:IS66 family insertion sequence element accessory protein TnpB [Agathobacter rectalis]|uniref:Transposase n=1 Tax=Agathobacter rectalis TaxID=39491 RepID=A0A412PZQ6_9FIRM|nr:IS66 family insertion sequence hypothetical protein [Agathobacter rectalis]RGT77367.1 IS66 family insertion sequence hypothetical protein [Agathobacter rectalis]
MLNDAVCFKNVYIVTGYTDLRFGIDSLAALIKSKLGKEPLVPDTLYLFCGRRTDSILSRLNLLHGRHLPPSY